MILLVDAFNIAYSGYYALKQSLKSTSDDVVTLYGCIRGIQTILERQPMLTHVFLCFDDGRPQRRLRIYPEYKANRKPDPGKEVLKLAVVEGIRRFRQLASFLPVYTVSIPDTESDDIIAGLCVHYPQVAKLIMSGDKDLLQMVDPMTAVYSPVKHVTVDLQNWLNLVYVKDADKEQISIAYDRYLHFRVLTGDPSDNIKGVYGVGDLTAARMLKIAPLVDILTTPATIARQAGVKSWNSIGVKLKKYESLDIIERNLELMDLRRYAPEIARACDAHIQTHSYNRQVVIETLHSVQFKSVLDKIQVFDVLDHKRQAAQHWNSQ